VHGVWASVSRGLLLSHTLRMGLKKHAGYPWNRWSIIWQHPLHDEGTASRVKCVGSCCQLLAGAGTISVQMNCCEEKPIFTWQFENTECFACVNDHSSFPSAIEVTRRLNLPSF